VHHRKRQAGQQCRSPNGGDAASRLHRQRNGFKALKHVATILDFFRDSPSKNSDGKQGKEAGQILNKVRLLAFQAE